MAETTKNLPGNPSYMRVYSSFTWAENGYTTGGDREEGTTVTYYYKSVNHTTGRGYSTIDLSGIPKGAKITGAHLSYNVTAGDYGTTGFNIILTGRNKVASDANILQTLQEMDTFDSLQLTFSYCANGGVSVSMSSQYDDREGTSYSTSLYFSSIQIAVTYEDESGDHVYYGEGNAWIPCKAFYGVNDEWVPVSIHGGSDDGWSGT